MARASSPGAEPFPPLNTSADHQLRQDEASAAARRRRVSSGLGSSLRVGDTGAPGLATSLMHLQGTASQSRDATTKRSSKRRKARSALRRARSYAIKHTWVIPLAILAIFGLVFAVNPTESNPVSRFIFLSYKIEPTSPGEVPQYGKGLWDIAFVSFYTVVLSFTREFIMQEVLRPLAKKAGLKSRAKQSRFMEQAYTAIYFGFLGPAGMYIMSRTPVWYFNVSGMYEAFPHKTHEAIFKFYYLFQAAYWAQQAIVMLLGMEEPRKDFKELIAHHIVSLALIGLSYRFHFTYMGLAVYITHDISDFFLATSKTLNYIDHWLIGPYYGLFCCVWIYMRHYLNIRILLSLFNEFKTVGPYELNWETGQYKCDLAFWITGTLLSSLQALNLFWLFYILRIAYRFVVHNVAKDDRSDEDESEGEIEAEAEEEDHKDGKSYAAAAAAASTTAISQNGNVKKR